MGLSGVARRVNRQNVSSVAGRALRGFATRYVDPERPMPFPATIQIEATSMCNLRCPLCSYSREGKAGRHLTPEQLSSALDWLPQSPPRVRLSGIGEPLVNPRVFELIDVLGDRGIQVELYTNGTLLGRRGNIDALLARQAIKNVSISCDGATAETFERMRVGARFDAWCAAVGSFVTEAKRERSGTLAVQAAACISHDNISELDDLIRLVGRLGIPYLYIRDPMAIDETAAEWCPTDEEIAGVASRTKALRELGSAVGVRVSFLFRRGIRAPSMELGTRLANAPMLGLRCRQPWEYIFIRSTGDVAPCCAVFGSDRLPSMGNIHEDTFEAIWRGPRFGAFRRSMVKGENDLCRDCAWY